MGYQVEDKQTREQFAVEIYCSYGRQGIESKTEYVWAYTLEEAEQILWDRGETVVN